jgi:glycosyltransferase involved in cell wall biosynthesis
MYGWGHDDSAVRTTFEGRIAYLETVEPPYRKKGWRKRWVQVMSLFTRRSGSYFFFYSQEMQAAIERAIAREEYDIIQIEAHVMGIFSFRGSRAFRLLNSQNVEYDTFRRMANTARSFIRRVYYWFESRKCYEEEIAIYRQQDALLVTSERDKEILDREIPAVRKIVIPNGVDTKYFHPSDDPEESNSIVFTGQMSYAPNADSMIYFIDEILPLIRTVVPDAMLYAVGSGPPKELLRRASPNVVVTGFVDDVRPYVYRSQVFVVPLLSGGGTRLKVLEAMAMKKAIVSTQIGCEGIEAVHGKSLLIANSADEFAREVIRLLKDAKLRSELSIEGHRFVSQKYEWESIGDKLLDTYAKIESQSLSRNQAKVQ